MGTSHFCLTKNESNFIFRLKIQAIDHLCTPRRESTALTILLPSLRVLQGRASFLLLLHKPKWVDIVEGERSRQERTSLSGDLAPLCPWACEISLIYTLLFI